MHVPTFRAQPPFLRPLVCRASCACGWQDTTARSYDLSFDAWLAHRHKARESTTPPPGWW